MLGRSIEVTGVCARSRGKERGIDLSARHAGSTIRSALATDPSIAVFVELMGGEEGLRKPRWKPRCEAKKHVVTANKALLAKHGLALAKLAEENGVALNFEAAVAGGIPIIKMLREALAANEVKRVYGILNGTCNFILTKMTDEKRAFGDALKEAQDRGLRRGRSDVRHRRLRRGPQARRLLVEPRVRDDHRVRPDPRRRHRADHRRPTSRPPPSSAIASSCWASLSARPTASRRASRRC